MARFGFLGAFVEVGSSATTHADLGGFDNQLTVQLRAGAPQTLDLRFTGELPHGSGSFNFTFPVEVDETDTVCIVGEGRTQGAAEVTLQVPSASGRPMKMTDLMPVGSAAPLGFAIIDKGNKFATWLRAVDRFLPIITLRTQPWIQTALQFDLRKQGSLTLTPIAPLGPVTMTFTDRFRPARGRSRSNRFPQRLILRQATAVHGRDRMDVVFDADSRFLLLNADVFDTASLSTLDRDGKPTANPLMYQYALVNGCLEWRIEFAALDDTRFVWRRQDDSAAEEVAAAAVPAQRRVRQPAGVHAQARLLRARLPLRHRSRGAAPVRRTTSTGSVPTSPSAS